MTVSKDAGFDVDWIDASTVAVLGRAAGFAFQPDELPAIADQLRRACEIASPLHGYDPVDEEELGPVWRP